LRIPNELASGPTEPGEKIRTRSDPKAPTPKPPSGTRKIVDVVFSFTDRSTDVVSKHFTRVDVTECFPFLVTKMSPYYDR
jgi:hypothetical protein